MDKRAKDKLAGTPGENGGRQGVQKDLQSTARRDKTERKTQKKWKEQVEGNLQTLGVRRWREIVTDRKKWRDIVQQAKAHNGL
jgi:hypothetical protein